MNGECPICHNIRPLVSHHWWEDEAHTIGHIRAICHVCNNKLKSDKDHLLPEWKLQVKIATKSRGKYGHRYGHRLMKSSRTLKAMIPNCYPINFESTMAEFDRVISGGKPRVFQPIRTVVEG